MATLFKNLRGNGSRDAEQTEEMRIVLRDVRTERSHCEALVKSARASIARLQELGEPIARAGSDMDAVTARLAELEQRLGAFERLSAQFQTLDERGERLGQSQRQAEARITHAAEDAQRISSLVEQLSEKVGLALDLKERIGSFLELEAPFSQLRSEADELRAQTERTGEQLTRIREQQEHVSDAHKVAQSKIDAFTGRDEELARALQDKERRVAGVEQALRGLDGIQQLMDDTMRRLDTLRALGDFVSQKTSALDAQRDAVERAVARADHLDQAMRQVDAGMRQLQENAKALGVMQEKVGGLQSLYEVVVQRSREIGQVQREHEEQVRSIRADLTRAQEEVQKSVERLDFESRGLESVGRRVADLRSALSDFETRFSGLAESKQTVEALQFQTQALGEQLESLGADVGRLDAETAKVKALRRDLDALAGTARDAGERVTRIEEAQPAVDAALREIEQLHSTHAMVKDALEQTQIAASEISRVRTEQSDTRTWLAGVQQSLHDVEASSVELRKLAPKLEFVQKQVQRVNESVAALELRRDFVEEMHGRLAELGSLGATLDDRGRDLQARMDAAEQRFIGLSAHAEEAEHLGKSVAVLSAGLEEAEREVGEIVKSLAMVEARCESVDGLAERTRMLRHEIEQRQHALDEATRDLERASQLRQEAAASAQELDERARRLAASIESADRQAAQVSALSTQLEDRAAGLQFVDKRLGQFEDRLAKWEVVEQEIARSLEQLSARQGTVEALQADVDRMFVLAERTSADVRAITSAHREIEESRALLDSVMSQLRDVSQMTSALDERKRQMTQAEGRLARAEALLTEVRSSLAVLQGQKVMVDQAVEKAGSLQFLLRQAEAMIEGLREERDMTTRVHEAVAAPQLDEDADADVQVARTG